MKAGLTDLAGAPTRLRAAEQRIATMTVVAIGACFQLLQFVLVYRQVTATGLGLNSNESAYIFVAAQGVLPALVVLAGTVLISRHRAIAATKIHSVPLSWSVLLPLVAAPAIISGLFHGWPHSLIVGDSYQLLVFPMGWYLVARVCASSEDVIEVAKFYIYFMLLAALAWLIFQVYAISYVSGGQIPFSTDVYLIPLLYLILVPNLSGRQVLAITALLAGSFLTLKRGVVAVTLSGFLGVLVYARHRLRAATKLSGAAAIGIAAALALTLAPTDAAVDPTTFNRFRFDDGVAPGVLRSASATERQSEATAVWESSKWSLRHDPVVALTGQGMGALVETDDGRSTHTVHITPAAFLHRTGWFGVLWLAVFLPLLWIWLARCWRTGMSRGGNAGAIIGALAAYALLRSTLGVAIGLTIWKDWQLIPVLGLLSAIEYQHDRRGINVESSVR